MRKVLIANRGEIAVRVARALRELGIPSVAVYSTADAESAVVRLADEAVCIGPPPPTRSYLHIPSIIGAAELTGADAIHPGYGFLSEDPYAAEICAAHGIIFIGPDPEVLEIMGDKSSARRVAAAAGLPLLPGTVEAVPTVEDARAVADTVGYPLIIKAAAGGGGRGMAVVDHPGDLTDRYRSTRAQAQLLFKDSAVYIERFLASARHVEIQILCDGTGHGIHLGERDCSVQRRHQKLLEEAPSPGMTPGLRAEMGTAALDAAKAISYRGVGTVEFLLDDDGSFYFMEMNTRIQVEHPVTEMVTGVDLVRQQITIAAGQRMGLQQQDVRMRGHALECRLNAEDSRRDFAPRSGRIAAFSPPGGPGIRLDTHCYPGFEVGPHYDSLLAKLIAWDTDREAAIRRMDRALSEFVLEGPGLVTTIEFHRRALASEAFRRGGVTTAFVSQEMS